MKQFILFLLVLTALNLQAQYDGWKISTDDIDASKYFGVTVANGMTGLVSSPEPFKVKDVVLNGAFDTYGRGRVSNIMKVFNTANVEFTNPKFTEEEKTVSYTHLTLPTTSRV